MRRIFLLLFILLGVSLICNVTEAKNQEKQKVIYQYKKYQKFDFEELGVTGDSSSPGDLSIRTRLQKSFVNKLPYRRNFDSQIRSAIERIR